MKLKHIYQGDSLREQKIKEILTKGWIFIFNKRIERIKMTKIFLEKNRK